MKIYYFDITVLRNRKVYDAMLQTIPADRQEKANRLKVTADKLRCVGAGLIIEHIKKEYNIKNELVTDKYGKPYFKDEDIKFNISHSGMFVIAAVTKSEVGIDIQKIKDDKHRIAERHFLESECAYINEIDDELVKQQRFCEIWTVKEAYLKYDGIGLRKPLNSFEVKIEDGNKKIAEHDELMIAQFKMNDKYVVSICTDGTDDDAQIEEIIIKK